MTLVLLAAEKPTVWSWVGVAVVGVLLALGGRQIVRGNERQHAAVGEDHGVGVATGPARRSARPVLAAMAVGAGVAFAMPAVFGTGVAGLGVIVAAVAVVMGAADRVGSESRRALWVVGAMPVMVVAFGLGAAVHS